MIRMDGKEVSAAVKQQIADRVKCMGIKPGLAVIIVGDDPASRIYVNNKKKACEFCGFLSEEYSLAGDTSEQELLELFNSPKWAELSESCLGCGTCTFVCPTCQCYDIREFDTGSEVKRFRCWDSCMYSDFTKMAHGNPRVSQLERFRQRFMHKLVYFPENNGGEIGCVGCGRCLSKCPISMNIVKVAKSLGVKEND